MPTPDPASDPGPCGDTAVDAQIAALRALGAPGFDPVRWRFIEALARRAAAHGDVVQRLLAPTLLEAITAYGERFDAARTEAARPDDQSRRGPLAELLADIDRQAPASGGLKSVQRFRSTWARLSVDRQLARSTAQAPENPGPLNSQRLVLRALRLMQDISPAYLGRFMAQVETLLWLEEANLGSAPVRDKAVPREGDRKRKPGRGKAV